jgi:hypothetical protein
MADNLEALRSAKQSVLVFGPQALSLQQETIDRLRAILHAHPRYSWIRNAVADLSNIWPVLGHVLPETGALAGQEAIQNILDLLLLPRARLKTNLARLPNLVLTPLVVVIHLVQYLDYLELTGREYGIEDNLADCQTKAIGFCTGLLVSSAVTSSKTELEFQKHGTAALRLAFCIGAVVDSLDLHGKDGTYQSLAATWNDIGEEAAMTLILGESERVGRHNR